MKKRAETKAEIEKKIDQCNRRLTMLKKTLIGVVLATIAVSGDASAQGITQQTATIKRTPLLQESCGKLAAETFRREPADENRVDYRAHYSIRLNKCFYEETYISLTPVGTNMWVYLSALQDNRIYGGFHMSTNIGLFYCNLLDRECHSEAEWNGLVKPYMEDAITTGTILPISACGLIRRSIGHGTSENWPAQFPELASTIFATAHGRFWHETDMPKYLGDVRCWVNSGKHLLSLSFSGFDPTRTWAKLVG